MRKTKLPSREMEICRRLREARELCQINQASCARQLGIERSTLLNYEQCRTPVRFGIALRFCRQFIISEEWLATGRFEACHAVAPNHGIKLGPGIEIMDQLIFKRQCVDLFSEPAALHIPPASLYSDAYDNFLAAEYAKLVAQFFYLPRIAVTDSDHPILALNLLGAIEERFISLLRNEAVRRGQKPSSAWRVFAAHLLDSADLIFRKMMRFRLSPEHLGRLEWMRSCTSDPGAIIPFLEETPSASPPDSPKIILPHVTVSGNVQTVKAKLPSLRRRLNQATTERGMKSELAKFMGVPLPNVSQWLSGEREPGGETTLQLLHWVEQQERSTKKP
jgi:transcriptional regulator with XRE-family HTH domain